MNRNRIAIFALGVACALLVVASVFAADANMGTWKINLGKSKYDPPNLAPKSTTAKNEGVDGGIKVTVDAVDYTGKSLHYDYAVKYDGKDVPVKGDPNRDMTSMKKIDDNTFEQTNKKDGKVTTTSRIVYAKDGKSRTLTTTGTNPQGQKVNNVIVWDKQ
jgi:hypothetical protein